jgi:hypothetical protein
MIAPKNMNLRQMSDFGGVEIGEMWGYPPYPKMVKLMIINKLYVKSSKDWG